MKPHEQRNAIPEESRASLIPILTKLFDVAFRTGKVKFKDAARFVLDTLRGREQTKPLADALTLKQMQGAYVAMDKEGANEPKRSVRSQVAR